jgi:hypothetical protein
MYAKKLGPRYGHFPNASKSLIVVKEEDHEKAVNIFGSSGLIITTEGNHYNGAPIGNRIYYEQHINDIINTWSEEVKTLTSIAQSQPQAAYAGFTKSANGCISCGHALWLMMRAPLLKMLFGTTFFLV